jgi:hypothetical protein
LDLVQFSNRIHNLPLFWNCWLETGLLFAIRWALDRMPFSPLVSKYPARALFDVGIFGSK